MSVFPGIANTGLKTNFQSTWHGGTFSLYLFFLLRGLKSSFSGNVLSCDISRSCQLSTINFHNGKILLNLAWEPYYKFLSDSIWFLSFLSRPYVYKRDGLQGRSICEKRMSLSFSLIYSKRPNQQQSPFFFPGLLWKAPWEQVFWMQNMLIEVERGESQTGGR